MVTNYEHLTADLTEKDLKYLEMVKTMIVVSVSGEHCTADKIIEYANHYFAETGIRYKLNQPILRKWVNFFRVNGIMPILADSKGYFISNDKDVIRTQIQSLRERANSINSAADGLQKFLY